jgi:dTDP-4-dehydrorhamnose reductase
MNERLRVLITGASGFVGRRFRSVLCQHTVVGTSFSRPGPGLESLDLRDKAAVHSLLSDLRPQVVVHCAARPSVDWCELHPEESWVANVETTTTLADECARLDALLVFLSTDYIFDGAAGPYRESDSPNPINVYGRLKLEAEDAIHQRTDRYLIVRTTNVYGFDLESKNFLMAILPRLARGDMVTVASDQVGSPTYVGDLCSVSADLMMNGFTGTVHMAGPTVMNRLEWAQSAARAFGLEPGLVAGVTTAELRQPAARPLLSGLVSQRLPDLISRPPIGLAEGLHLMSCEWNQDVPIACW